MTSILSLAIGGVAGMLKFIISKHMEFRQEERIAGSVHAKELLASRNRAANLGDKGVSFTRRVLAFTFAAGLVAPVFYGLMYPDATITVPETYLKKGMWDHLLPWREGKEMVKYIEIKAPIIAMPIYDICAMIIGFYFGSGGSRGR